MLAPRSGGRLIGNGERIAICDSYTGKKRRSSKALGEGEQLILSPPHPYKSMYIHDEVLNLTYLQWHGTVRLSADNIRVISHHARFWGFLCMSGWQKKSFTSSRR